MAGKSALEYWLKENTENYTGEFVNDHYQGQVPIAGSMGTGMKGAFCWRQAWL